MGSKKSSSSAFEVPSWLSTSASVAYSIAEDPETWRFLLTFSLYAILTILVALGIRLLCFLWNPSRIVPCAPQLKKHPLRVMVVLGSGGHTTEMIQNLKLLGSKWTHHRCTYIVSENDNDSANAAKVFEQSIRRFATVRLIPRARNVGQSYTSSVKTTLLAIWSCLSLVWEERPDIILTNGPGVCIPVVYSSLLISALSAISLTSFWSSSDEGENKRARPMIAYFESFTCVDHLSLSGKLMRPVSDIFTVQWPQLLALNRPCKRGHTTSKPVVLVGPYANLAVGEKEAEDDEADASTADTHGRLHFLRDANRVAMVTVGSTKFDDLIRQVPNKGFLEALKRARVTTLYVQKGRSDAALLCEVVNDTPVASGVVSPASPSSPAAASLTAASTTSTEANFIERALKDYGITVDIFDYKPNMAATFLKRGIVGGGIGGATSSSCATSPSRSMSPSSVATPTTSFPSLSPVRSPASLMNTTAINSSPNGGGGGTILTSYGPQTVDLLIAHAGAGTILEAFSYRIPTIVVPNAKLMNNHQLVFAEQLSERGYLVSTASIDGKERGGTGIAAAVDIVREMCDGGGASTAAEKSSPLSHLKAFPSPNSEIIRDLFSVLVGSSSHAHDGKKAHANAAAAAMVEKRFT